MNNHRTKYNKSNLTKIENENSGDVKFPGQSNMNTRKSNFQFTVFHVWKKISKFCKTHFTSIGDHTKIWPCSPCTETTTVMSLFLLWIVQISPSIFSFIHRFFPICRQQSTGLIRQKCTSNWLLPRRHIKPYYKQKIKMVFFKSKLVKVHQNINKIQKIKYKKNNGWCSCLHVFTYCIY